MCLTAAARSLRTAYLMQLSKRRPPYTDLPVDQLLITRHGEIATQQERLIELQSVGSALTVLTRMAVRP